MGVRGHRRNLRGEHSAVACEAALVQRGGYRVHGTGSSTRPVTRDFFSMIDDPMPSSKSQTDISTVEQSWAIGKLIHAPTWTPDDRGVGEDTIGDFSSRTISSPILYRPTGLWLPGSSRD